MTSNAYPNAGTIIAFLRKEGYSLAAAAGIYGNIYQESTGNPEATEIGGGGGEGLIQWTGTTPYPNANIITGNASTDLSTQLQDVLAWAKTNNASPSVMNAAVGNDPSTAAQYFETNAERAGTPDMSNRIAAAQAVYALGQQGKLGSGVSTSASTKSSTSSSGSAPLSNAANILEWVTDPAGKLALTVASPVGDSLAAIGKEFASIGKFFDQLILPETWIRIGACIGGVIMFIIGFMVLMHADESIESAAGKVAAGAMAA